MGRIRREVSKEDWAGRSSDWCNSEKVLAKATELQVQTGCEGRPVLGRDDQAVGSQLGWKLSREISTSA